MDLIIAYYIDELSNNKGLKDSKRIEYEENLKRYFDLFIMRKTNNWSWQGIKMKKETKTNNITVYDADVSRKSLEEIIVDILKSYKQGKKIKVSVSIQNIKTFRQYQI